MLQKIKQRTYVPHILIIKTNRHFPYTFGLCFHRSCRISIGPKCICKPVNQYIRVDPDPPICPLTRMISSWVISSNCFPLKYDSDKPIPPNLPPTLLPYRKV